MKHPLGPAPRKRRVSGGLPGRRRPGQVTYPSDRVRNTATGPRGVITSVSPPPPAWRPQGEHTRAVANRSPFSRYRSGFSVPHQVGALPVRPTEVRPRHSSPAPPSSGAWRWFAPRFYRDQSPSPARHPPPGAPEAVSKRRPPFLAVFGLFVTAIIRALQGFCQWRKTPGRRNRSGRETRGAAPNFAI